MLIRTGAPCKYDQSPCGTLCKKVTSLSDKFEVYIQMSKDESKPCWEKIGIFTTETENLIEVEVKRILGIK